MDAVLEFHTEAPQATTSEELDQGPYVAGRVGFEPATLLIFSTQMSTKPIS